MIFVAGCGPAEPRDPCANSDGLETLCGLSNPEDLVLVPGTGRILVSNMRRDVGEPSGGFISEIIPESDTPPRRIWPREAREDEMEVSWQQPSTRSSGAPSCPGPPDPEAFYPHGVTVAGSDPEFLYVVAHAGESGGREAVEIFAIGTEDSQTSLRWSGCIPMPKGTAANDVAVLPDASVIVSNYAPELSVRYMLAATVFGQATGNIMLWRESDGWKVIDNTTARLANGVAVSPDGQTLFYAETMTGELHRLRLDATGGKISVDIGGNPDNLTWTRNGSLLIATHTDGVAFMPCAFGRQPCRSGWAVYEIDPVTLAARPVLEHDGEDLGAVATALEVNGRIYLGAVFDDRVGTVPVMTPK